MKIKISWQPEGMTRPGAPVHQTVGVSAGGAGRAGTSGTGQATLQQPPGGQAPGIVRRVALTSGPVRVPMEQNLTLNLSAVNFGGADFPIAFRVLRLTGAEPMEQIFARETTVPAGRGINMDIPAPAGQAVVIEADYSAEARGLLVASADVVQFFPADGATTPQIVLAAGDLIEPLAPGEVILAGPATFTTGLLAVPQGVAAARPQAEVIMSNPSDNAVEAKITVSRLIPELQRLQVVLEREVSIPAGGAVLTPLESVEGERALITVDFPGGPGQITWSYEVYTLFLADESTLPVYRVGPGGWVSVRR